MSPKFFHLLYLNGSLYKARMDFLLVNSEKGEIVKMKHLPMGRPVLDTFDPALDDCCYCYWRTNNQTSHHFLVPPVLGC